MIDLTIYLNEKYGEVDKNDLAKRVAEAIGDNFGKNVQVRVSDVTTSKPAELIFNEMSPVDIEDVEEIAGDAVTAMIFAINSLDGKSIHITAKPTIVFDLQGDVL